MDSVPIGNTLSPVYWASQFGLLAEQLPLFLTTVWQSLDGVSTWEWVVILLCLVTSALFSASETALTALTQPKVRQLIDKDPEKFGVFRLWLEYPNQVLSTILVGNNLVNILASALATDIARRIFGNQGVAIAVGVMTLMVLIGGEVVPKTFAKHHAQRVATTLFPVLRITYYCFLPITMVLVFLATGLVRMFGGDLERSGPFVTEEDIEYLIDLGSREGVLDEEKERLLNSILEFDDITIREIMVPRTNMSALPLNATPEQLLELAQNAAHSRIPVYDEQLDNVVGMLYLRDLFRMQTSANGKSLFAEKWDELLRAPYFVPGTMKISDLLREFQRRKSHLAIVVDEFGGTMGLVTLEDILEEIVGEIHDEYDTDEIEEVIPIAEDVFHADAKVSLRSLEELLSMEFPDDGDYETLGGFLTAHTGRVPQGGESVSSEGYRFLVLEANEKHVCQVEIRRLPQAELQPEEDFPTNHPTSSDVLSSVKSEHV